MPQVGDKTRFLPSGFLDSNTSFFGSSHIPTEVTGTVTYVNEAHRMYRVAFSVNGYSMNECFKF